MENDDDYVPYVPIKQRRLEKLHKYATQRRLVDPGPREEVEEEEAPVTRSSKSLLDQTVEYKKQHGDSGKCINQQTDSR